MDASDRTERRLKLRDLRILMAAVQAGSMHKAAERLATMAAGPAFAIIDRLTRRYPRMVFNVMTGTGAALYHYLAERDVDLVISRITEPLPENMVMESLFDDAMVVVAAKQNPWTRRRKIELAELVDEPWTLPPFDSFAGAIALDAFRAIGLKPPSATVITLSINMRNRLLATGRFITLLTGYSLILPGKHHSLRALPVELSHSRGTVAIVTLRNRTLRPLADLFIKTAHAVTRPLAKAR